ncbi:RNA 3'-terminal phosphate cyclase [Planctomycetota bacterium]|nr:RNA 3'-terminal phosphate cyclase [Planctomycetota bacterium]
MLIIDGSQGEGGGQILRTALALSAITGTTVKIENIRARRPKPGLQRQHLVAVQAAARVCNGQLEGDALNSREITLTPQSPVSGDWHFDIGSAGSTSLVLQTVLPILLHAPGPSTVHLAGGTHNSLAPPLEFLTDSFFPVLYCIGISVTAELQRHGFYPAGGGAMSASIQPWQARVPLDLMERGKSIGRHAQVLISHLPAHVASREAQAVKHALHWSHAEVDETEVKAAGPGNCLIAKLRFAQVAAVFTAFGELRKSAEKVAQECVSQVTGYLDHDAPVCEHLADQLLLPLALGAGGRFRTGKPSDHTITNATIIGLFLGDRIVLADNGDRTWTVTVRGGTA